MLSSFALAFCSAAGGRLARSRRRRRPPRVHLEGCRAESRPCEHLGAVRRQPRQCRACRAQ
eukprot:4368808-Pyramimonas_sp.AAC.1